MTASLIELETLDLVAASRLLRLWVAEPVELETRALWSTLEDCAGMAGSDPGGSAWARSYDQAAAAAVNAAAEAINGVDVLAGMFAQTARNYEAADAASTAAERRVIAASVATLPCIGSFMLPSCAPPPAAGGSGGAPHGWGLIANLVGYVWPNGHQDRLRAAASAWRRSAAALAHGADDAVQAVSRAVSDRLPEAGDMWTVCDAMSAHLSELAGVHSALADACEEFAHHLDRVHSEVIGELTSLVEWTAAIEASGAALSVFTLGIAEAPTQAVEAARVAKTAASVGALIEKFVGIARGLAVTVARLVERAEAVSTRLRVVLSARLAEASVAIVGRARLIKEIGTETGAIGRLSSNAARIAMRNVDNPKLFDPEVLRGMKIEDVRAGIPKTWTRRPATNGEGDVYIDPANRGRQIRIMRGYPKGSRPDPTTTGPYAVVSQLGRPPVKIPLEGNPTLP